MYWRSLSKLRDLYEEGGMRRGVRNMVTEKIQTKDVMVWTRKFTLECVLLEQRKCLLVL